MGEAESKNHHYVPVFLLEHFVSGPDDMLQAYSWNQHKQILWKAPKSPKAVCYQPYLYTTRTHQDRPDELEKGLFGDVDTRASRVVQRLVDRLEIKDEDRDELLTFLFSLDARRPAVVEAARQYGPEQLAEKLNNDPEILERISALGMSARPSDLAFSDDDMSPADRLAFDLTEGLVKRPKYATELRAATWAVRHFDQSVAVSPLALSDRPLIRVRGIHRNFIWALPLAPDCVLLITRLPENMANLGAMSDKQLVNALNSDAAMQCDKYVFWSGNGPTGWLERRLNARHQQARQSAEEIAKRAFA